MNNEQTMLLLFSSVITILIIITCIYLTLQLGKMFLIRRKEKKAKILLEKGYEIETVDKNGIPHLMRRGAFVDNVFKITKKEKKQ